MPWKWGVAVVVVVFLAAGAIAENLVVENPMMIYGLGGRESLAVSPDGRLIATSGDGGIVIWDAENYEVVRRLDDHHKWFHGVRFLPTNETVLIATTGKGCEGEPVTRLSRWNMGESSEPETIALYPIDGPISFSTFDVSANGQRLLANGRHCLSAETGTMISEFDAYDEITLSSFRGLAPVISPDGSKAVTADYYGLAFLWNTTTGTTIRSWSPVDESTGVSAVDFSLDGSRIVTGYNELSEWDVGTGIRLRSCHIGVNISSLDISPDGNMVLVTPDANFTSYGLWDLVSNTYQEYRSEIAGLSGTYGAFLGSSSRFATFSDADGMFRVWSRSSHDLLGMMGLYSSDSEILLNPRNNHLLSVSGIEFDSWDPITGVLADRIRPQGSIYSGPSISPDGMKMAYVSSGYPYNTVVVIDSDSGEQIAEFSTERDAPPDDYVGDSAQITCFSPDGKMLAAGLHSGEDKNKPTLMVWDLEAEELMYIRIVSSGQSDPYFDWMKCISFSPDGSMIATGSKAGHVYVWDSESGQLLFHEDLGWETYSVRYHPSSNEFSASFLADDFSIKIRFWESGSNEMRRDLYIPGATLIGSPDFGHEFSPDGSLIAVRGGCGSVVLRDMVDFEALRTLNGNHYSINSVIFSPDGKALYTADSDGAIYRWAFRPKDKLLIVAGGGDYPGNAIAQQTQHLARYAHRVATTRGYDSENIRLLSAFSDWETDPLVHDFATEPSIEDAITVWASDAWRLTVILLDHGIWNDRGTATQEDDTWSFMINGTTNPPQFLTGRELDELLDDTQAPGDGIDEVVLYVDMCYAGGLARRASQPPEGRRRLAMASTMDDRLASFGGGTTAPLSFTSFYLSSLMRGSSHLDSFEIANTAIQSLRTPRNLPQHGWMDDDGDGLFTGFDGEFARSIVFGNYSAFASIAPVVLDAKADEQIDPGQNLRIWAELEEAIPVDRAEVYLTYGNEFYIPGQPIVDHEVVPLSYEGGTGVYAGTIPADALQRRGTYNLLYTAVRSDILDSTIEHAATPLSRTLTVGTLVAGDADLDGEITPADAQAVFECYMDAQCPPGVDAAGADYCNDTVLTPADAEAIFELYLQRIPSCP